MWSVSFNNELIMNAKLMACLIDTEHAAVILQRLLQPVTEPQLLLVPYVSLLLSL